MMQNDTIAAIATPNAAGGISMIRISGPKAVQIADKIFQPLSGQPLSERKGYTGAYGTAYDEQGEIDNLIAFVYRAPKSYTGEEVVELSCHGGIIVTRRLLRAVLDAGARLADPGEFTKRAFLNGKMTLTQAESVMDLVNSQSEQDARCAVDLDGERIYNGWGRLGSGWLPNPPISPHGSTSRRRTSTRSSSLFCGGSCWRSRESSRS